jgi:PAS domain S-box-containing protein
MPDSRVTPAPATPAPVALDTEAARTIARLTARGMLAADPAGCVVWMNDGFTRMTGFTLADMLGRRPGALLHGKDTDPETVRHMRGCIARGVSFDIEVLNYRKGGGPFWARIEVHPVRDAAGTVTGYVSLHTDVTRRREAMLRLERSESESRELAIVADRIPGPVSIEKPDGTILWVNRGWTRCYGYPPSEAIGRRSGDLLDGPQSDPQRRIAMHDAASRGESIRAAMVKYTREGVERRMIVERQPVRDPLGKVARVVCMATELADQRVDGPAAGDVPGAERDGDLLWSDTLVATQGWLPDALAR